MMQKFNVPHGPVRTPTERTPFFTKFKRKVVRPVALGLTFTVLAPFAAAQFRKFSPFAEKAAVWADEKKEEVKSILEQKVPNTLTVKEGELEVTFTNSSCVLDVVYKGKKFSLDIKDRNNKNEKKKMEFFHCYEAVIFPEYPSVGVLGTYKREGEKIKTGVFIVGMTFGEITGIIAAPAKIEKFDAEKIKVTDMAGNKIIFSATTGKYLSDESLDEILKKIAPEKQ